MVPKRFRACAYPWLLEGRVEAVPLPLPTTDNKAFSWDIPFSELYPWSREAPGSWLTG